MQAQYRELFGVPLYKFKYPRHFETKQLYVNYFEDSSNFIESSERCENTFFSKPNLHKENLFEPLTKFIEECVSTSFVDMGFVPEFEITSMWGVKQKTGGSHHKHTHSNTFLVGVYYLNGDVNTKGTIFHPPYSQHKIIYPRVLEGKITKPNINRMITFEEGSVVVFPAWLEHEVTENENDNIRNIIAFNCMPVGVTNNANYDRYEYKSQKDVVYVEDTKQLQGKKFQIET